MIIASSLAIRLWSLRIITPPTTSKSSSLFEINWLLQICFECLDFVSYHEQMQLTAEYTSSLAALFQRKIISLLLHSTLSLSRSKQLQMSTLEISHPLACDLIVSHGMYGPAIRLHRETSSRCVHMGSSNVQSREGKSRFEKGCKRITKKKYTLYTPETNIKGNSKGFSIFLSIYSKFVTMSSSALAEASWVRFAHSPSTREECRDAINRVVRSSSEISPRS